MLSVQMLIEEAFAGYAVNEAIRSLEEQVKSLQTAAASLAQQYTANRVQLLFSHREDGADFYNGDQKQTLVEGDSNLERELKAKVTEANTTEQKLAALKVWAPKFNWPTA
jgi:hypothetical protein